MFIAANWKMNLDKKSIKSFVEHLKIYKFSKNVQLCIFPPTIYIDYLSELIENIPISNNDLYPLIYLHDEGDHVKFFYNYEDPILELD